RCSDGGRLRLAWVAPLPWSTWQRSRGLGGRHPVDWVAAFTWTEWQPSDGLGGRNPWNTHTGFVYADEPLLLNKLLGIMHEHLGHGLTDRVGGKELAGLVIVDFEAMIESPQHIRCLVLQTRGEHAEQRRELLKLFGLVLLHNRQVLLLTCSFVDGISHVA